MTEATPSTSKRKRQAAESSSAVDAGPKSKRRREGGTGMSITIPGLKQRKSATPAIDTSEREDDKAESGQGGDRASHGIERVKELGLQIWNAVRAARSTEGHEVAYDFLQLPPKRTYPDYYKIIKKPIALDDIKQKIDRGSYLTLKDVKGDFDLCFRNARRYNMENSPIWVAAKIMQKIANAEYKSLSATPGTEDEDVDVGGDDENHAGDSDGDASDDGDDGALNGAKKPRKQDLSRLLTSKLQKMIKKAPLDETGASYSEPFMHLPIKKDWPDYYRIIQKPIALDMILKKLKKKAYSSSGEFSADVELLFENALLFNQDRSFIWNAAQTLRQNFRKYMAELPAEHALPVTNAAPKIKLRVQPKPESPTGPIASTSKSPPQPPSRPATAPAPTAKPTETGRHRQPSAKAAAAAAVNPTVAVPAATVPTPTPQPKHVQGAPPPPSYYTPAASQHRPLTMYHPQPQPPPPAVPPAPPPPSTFPPTPPVAPRSPTPEIVPTTIIRSVTIVTEPALRTISLRGTPPGQGVCIRNWALRLGLNETSIRFRVDAERGVEEDEEKSVDEAEPTIEVDGKKLPVEVKCNNLFIAPTPPLPSAALPTSAPSTTLADADMADGTGGPDTPVTTNGHHADGTQSDSDSEGDDEEKEKGKGPARATRSGQVPTSVRNGKPRKKRRSKKTSETVVLSDLGPWNIPLNIGGNVLDVRVGGKDGEGWRIFVDRML